MARNQAQPFGQQELVGYYEVPEAETVRQLYEFAAWWTDIRVPAGRYPILLCRRGYGEQPYVLVRLRGTIVASYTQAHFGGMPCGNQPQGAQHRDVGREAEHSLQLDLYALGRILANRAGDQRHGPTTAHASRFHLLPGWSYRVSSFVVREPQSHLYSCEGGRYTWGKVTATRWAHVPELARQLALPAPARGQEVAR